jgi:hypothetical protein
LHGLDADVGKGADGCTGGRRKLAESISEVTTVSTSVMLGM